MQFMATLLKLLWSAQLNYWNEYTNAQHRDENNRRITPADKTTQYKLRIRHLHDQQHKCLPGHRNLYFYSNVEEYLEQATNTQMRLYLQHYEPAIHRSIAAARQQPTSTLFRFPGFTRLQPRPNSSKATN